MKPTPELTPQLFPRTLRRMAKKASVKTVASSLRLETYGQRPDSTRLKPSALLDTRVVYCGDNLEQLGPCQPWRLGVEPRSRISRISRFTP